MTTASVTNPDPWAWLYNTTAAATEVADTIKDIQNTFGTPSTQSPTAGTVGQTPTKDANGGQAEPITLENWTWSEIALGVLVVAGTVYVGFKIIKRM